MPWCTNPSQVAQVVDIFPQGGNFLAVFETPESVVVKDELAVFKDLVASLQFLSLKKLALAKVDPSVFCRGSGEQLRKLSPHCRMVSDKDGSLLCKNMKAIEALGYFKNPRILAAFHGTGG